MANKTNEKILNELKKTLFQRIIGNINRYFLSKKFSKEKYRYTSRVDDALISTLLQITKEGIVPPETVKTNYLKILNEEEQELFEKRFKKLNGEIGKAYSLKKPLKIDEKQFDAPSTLMIADTDPVQTSTDYLKVHGVYYRGIAIIGMPSTKINQKTGESESFIKTLRNKKDLSFSLRVKIHNTNIYEPILFIKDKKTNLENRINFKKAEGITYEKEQEEYNYWGDLLNLIRDKDSHFRKVSIIIQVRGYNLNELNQSTEDVQEILRNFGYYNQVLVNDQINVFKSFVYFKNTLSGAISSYLPARAIANLLVQK